MSAQHHADSTNSRTLGALAGLPLFRAGGPSDNMPPRKASVPSRLVADAAVVVLQQGLDTLVLNYYGPLREDVALCLEMAKEDAQESPTGEAASPLPPFDGVIPLMQERGAPYYEWRLRSRDLTVTIAKPSRSRRPNAVVRVSSECLWRMGGGGAVAARLAAVYLAPLFDGFPVVQVSSAHLATDYQGHVPSLEDRRGVVKRARTLREHFVGEVDESGMEWHTVNEAAQSFSAGRSTTLRVNGYDKTAEVKKSGKDWFLALWERHEGYVPTAPVWRIEYQFGREMLHERGIEDVPALLDALPALWSYAVGWFSFRSVNLDDLAHRSRWPVAPWWLALSSWRSVAADPLPRIKVVRPGYRQLVNGFVGYLTSLMAVTERLDPSEALWSALAYVVAARGPSALDDSLSAKQLRYAGFTMASA